MNDKTRTNALRVISAFIENPMIPTGIRVYINIAAALSGTPNKRPSFLPYVKFFKEIVN
jgi:hypothetical protein